MKKLFTLIALLSCFLGAKAEWVEDFKVDYSTFQGFPYYVMGYVPEWIDGVMTDLGGNYRYVEVTDDATETSDVIVSTNSGVQYYRLPSDGTWHQYFIATGIPTEIDGSYTVKAMVRASETCTVPVQMRWSWGQDPANASATIGTEWAEVEWEFSGIGGNACDLIAQPNTAAQIEWKSLTVSHFQKEQRPVTWQEWLTSDGQPVIVDGSTIATYMGDAETPWADPNVKFNDQEKNYLICAWGKEREVNMNDEGGWDPFPATIEQEDNGNHYFIVHGKAATTEGDASAWDNQFWIQSPKSWKSGDQVKIHFRYKASKNVTVATQCHHQNPSDYLIYHAVGDVSFTEEWQDFDYTMSIADDMAGTWSIAFQLNQNDKEAIDFYFDDLSWQSMKLDEGYFLAGSNPAEGLEYDLDNAVQFEYDEDADIPCWTATVGAKGAYVSQIMISTVRGNDAAFKSATLKPTGAIVNDPEEWLDYSESSLAKLNLPGSGIWKVYLNDEYRKMAFEMLEGTSIDPIVINPNPSLIVVNGQERDDLQDTDTEVREGEGGTGQTWDNQFWVMANRTLSAGETTILQFKYKSSIPAKTTTQCHTTPGQYLHWGAINDVNFTEEWQDYETTFTVPGEANNMQSIAFNMAEIKEACKYELKDFVWKLEDGTESLINQVGTENFFVKEGAGSEPHVYVDPDGISSVVTRNNVSTVTYNLAGQRVSKDYKGIVIKNGSKYIAK